MDIGFDVRIPHVVDQPDGLTMLVTEGERLGYDYTTVSDHLVVAASVQPKYANGPEAPAYGRCFEQLTTIAFLAAKTSRLRFVTSVMVAPYRPPVLAAKVLSTIDVLSGGRLTVGVGTGWIVQEFEALGAPDFSVRGQVTDEFIEAMKILWTDSASGFDGQHVSFSEIRIEPRPVQRPHPPLWIGGMSGPAMRRAARFGDAWYPMLSDQAKPLDSVPRLKAAIADLRRRIIAAGRDPARVTVAVRVSAYGESVPATASDGERRLFSGCAADHATDLNSLRELGVTAVNFRFDQESPEHALDEMETLQRDVLGKL